MLIRRGAHNPCPPCPSPNRVWFLRDTLRLTRVYEKGIAIRLGCNPHSGTDDGGQLALVEATIQRDGTIAQLEGHAKIQWDHLEDDSRWDHEA